MWSVLRCGNMIINFVFLFQGISVLFLEILSFYCHSDLVSNTRTVGPLNSFMEVFFPINLCLVKFLNKSWFLLLKYFRRGMPIDYFYFLEKLRCFFLWRIRLPVLDFLQYSKEKAIDELTNNTFKDYR